MHFKCFVKSPSARAWGGRGGGGRGGERKREVCVWVWVDVLGGGGLQRLLLKLSGKPSSCR